MYNETELATFIVIVRCSTKQPKLLHHRPLLCYQRRTEDSLERVIFQFSRRSFSDSEPSPKLVCDSDLHIDPSTRVDPSDVFGLDVTQMPQQLQINIPTIHIYGRIDSRLPASIQLIHLSDPTKRMVYEHEGGHNIPRNSVAAERIASLMNECAQLVI